VYSVRHISRTAPILLAALLLGAPAARADEARFLSENDTAMRTMMAGMNVKPTGDVDRDFVIMMSAHHQGAIDMARAELRHGRNERLRRLAQEIIVTQQQEIAAMWLAIGQRPPASALGTPAATDAAGPMPQHSHSPREP
jgi:DUF305 family protein family protein